MYSLIKPLLFRLDPEKSHDLVLSVLAALSGSGMAIRAMRRRHRRHPAKPVSFMGLSTSNPIGMAAGLDKDARAFPALRALGFGWVEVGTVTPRPQPGNERPRLFRLEADRALINRMGFNSCGVDRLVRNVASRRDRYDSILGINIGKNARTPIDAAEEDYIHALEKVHAFADYVAVNISSPNTDSLRDLQHLERLDRLLAALMNKRRSLDGQWGRRVPIAVKLSPDLPVDTLEALCSKLLDHGVDGVIATNTTISRPEWLTNRHKTQTGGLSGAPLEPLATGIVAALHEYLRGAIPIIGVGGVEDSYTVDRKRAAGASAIQCYTAFIYHGPRLLRRLQSGEVSGDRAHP